MTRIEDADLSLFEFDYDLTFMVFFLDAEERIYGRYGGRDSKDPDSRQSLAGLRHAMQAVRDVHDRQDIPIGLQRRNAPKYIEDYTAAINGGGCIHCHEAKEIINQDLMASGNWNRDLVWRYPLPDNLGLVLEVDRGDVVERVVPDSPAGRLGLRRGDVVESLADLPIHSFADAQFAPDRAPSTGSLEISWRRGDQVVNGKLELPVGWRKTDITWRTSMLALIPSSPLNGRDLSAEERKTHGLSESQLAFVPKSPVSAAASKAGIRKGDIILGFDGKTVEMEAYDFVRYVGENYLADDRVLVDVLRNGQRLQFPMTLRGRFR